MAGDPTRGRHANAMHRAFRRLGKGLDGTLRNDILGRIRAYERGELPLAELMALLILHMTGASMRWAADQTYLAPFPSALCPHES